MSQILTSDFKVGDTAYVISDIRYPSHAYPVKVLSVNKSRVITTAPPIDLRYVGVGFRNKFVFKKIPFTNNCNNLYLENERAYITILLPSINHIRTFVGERYKSFEVENYSYSTSDENYIKYIPYYNNESNIRHCLIVHMGKTGITRFEIAKKLGVSIQWLNAYLRMTAIVLDKKEKMLKDLLIEFGYEFIEKGEE